MCFGFAQTWIPIPGPPGGEIYNLSELVASSTQRMIKRSRKLRPGRPGSFPGGPLTLVQRRHAPQPVASSASPRPRPSHGSRPFSGPRPSPPPLNLGHDLAPVPHVPPSGYGRALSASPHSPACSGRRHEHWHLHRVSAFQLPRRGPRGSCGHLRHREGVRASNR